MPMGMAIFNGDIKMKLTKGKFMMAALFIGFVVLVRYAMRDMRLDVDILREGLMRMPGMAMENIRMEREVSGDLWRVDVPWLEQQGVGVSLRSLDIRRQLRDGGEWSFFGAEGVYSHDLKAARVRGLMGTLEASGRVWNLESPSLNWAEASGDFTFPEGLTLYDEEFLLVTSEASMDASGAVLLEKGGSIQWKRPLKP